MLNPRLLSVLALVLLLPNEAGAADLGSQRTILILDVGRLIEEATRMGGSATAA